MKQNIEFFFSFSIFNLKNLFMCFFLRKNFFFSTKS